ncbi:hypothetical protein IEN85_09905 [Pelagicoccus sp. NFK12]|uniref:Uncharacterized protein n=1 Tax=Pelagicoccus enzymogenes TaxID=2773457 RepID=A0A927IH41_9BACT|nr:hypothetical protein [Pelagicoccus enzymogenes]MBD5779806.1 hypothetical protein [Pelagicoccus enzymogenes]
MPYNSGQRSALASAYALSVQQIMRKKRFKHHVHIFCHMFCGWQIVNDHKRLLEMQSGELKINVLSAECAHNGNRIEPLLIAETIRDWFLEDLKTQRIENKDIEKAELIVEFEVSKDLKSSKSAPNIEHRFECTGILETEDTRYLEEFESIDGNQRINRAEQVSSHNSGGCAPSA